MNIPSPGARLDLAVLKARLAALPAGVPHSLFIGLTTRCDLACRHCKYRAEAAGAELSPAALSRLLAAAARAGIPRVVFFGGEPLLYPGLRAAVRQAASLGRFTELDTNGQRLSPRLAASLAGDGLSAAMISLHSADPGRHDALSGRGSFRRAAAAVRAARRAGLITYISSCVFSNALSSGETARLLAWAKEHGAHGARLLPYSPPSGASRLPARLAAGLRRASPDGYARTCAGAGGGCAATRGEVLFCGADGTVRACPYAVKPLGRASAGLKKFIDRKAGAAGALPCHGPARVC